MGLGLFLLPTIGGYWLLTHLNYTRYRTFRESGYHLLFNSAFAGVILFGAAQVTSLFLDHCFPQLGVWWAHYFSTPHSDTAVLSVVSGIAVPLAANCLYDSDRAARRAAKENNDFVELLMAESLSRGEFVELSLRSRKSYIGFALESGIKRQQGEPDVSLIPVASGYRREDDQELEITTLYAAVIEQSLEEEPSHISDEDFRVVIPISEIVSARLFFPEAYELFREQADESLEDV